MTMNGLPSRRRCRSPAPAPRAGCGARRRRAPPSGTAARPRAPPAAFGSISLTATGAPSPRCSARQTVPIPPCPSTDSSRYFPATIGEVIPGRGLACVTTMECSPRRGAAMFSDRGPQDPPPVDAPGCHRFETPLVSCHHLRPSGHPYAWPLDVSSFGRGPSRWSPWPARRLKVRAARPRAPAGMPPGGNSGTGGNTAPGGSGGVQGTAGGSGSSNGGAGSPGSGEPQAAAAARGRAARRGRAEQRVRAGPRGARARRAPADAAARRAPAARQAPAARRAPAAARRAAGGTTGSAAARRAAAAPRAAAAARTGADQCRAHRLGDPHRPNRWSVQRHGRRQRRAHGRDDLRGAPAGTRPTARRA